MTEPLVPFRCVQCGYNAFRSRSVYERMTAERGWAWRLICAPVLYRAPFRETLGVAYVLIKRSPCTVDWAQAHIRISPCAAGARRDEPGDGDF
jgi:hypothetical protein